MGERRSQYFDIILGSLRFCFAAPVLAGKDSTYWETKAPPSSVLGPTLSKMSSGSLGVASIFALAGAGYAAGAAGLYQVDVSVAIVNAGLAPVAWGLHVASWIQKENGK